MSEGGSCKSPPIPAASFRTLILVLRRGAYLRDKLLTMYSDSQFPASMVLYIGIIPYISATDQAAACSWRLCRRRLTAF